MSVKQMAIVWDLDLPHNQKFVLLAYADHADDDGDNVYPSLERIAHKTGYSRDQVRRISKELKARGLMELVAKATPTHPARYRLTLEGGGKLQPLKPRRGVANDPSPEGVQMPPEPSGINHQVSTPSEPNGSSGDAKASPDIERDTFGYFCSLAQALEVLITPEDRKQMAKHFKDLKRLEKPSRLELRRAVSKILEARTSGYDMSPQKALDKVRNGNQPSGLHVVTPTPEDAVVAICADADLVRYAETCKVWDYTRDEDPPWQVMARLGGTDGERQQHLKWLRRIAKGAVRKDTG
jgi:hypothetical protein